MPTATLSEIDTGTPQSGGTATLADLADEHTQAGGFLDAVGRFGQGFYDKTLKGAVDTLGAAGHAIMHPIDTASAIANSPIVQHPIDTAVEAAKNAYQTHAGMLQQAKQSFQRGDYDDALQRGTNALIPVLGPQIQSSTDKVKSGDVAGGLGELVGTLGTVLAAAPGVSEAVASKVGDLTDAIAGGASRAVAKKLYQSALKPSQVDPDAAAAAVQAGLKNRIPISDAGKARLDSLVSNLSDKVKDVIASDPNATVDPQAVASRLDATRGRFANQVNPVSDVSTVDRARQEFLSQAGARPGVPATAPQPTGVLDASGKPVMTAGTPATPPTPAPPMSAADAQAMKQGTYAINRGKYGELSSAQVESEKALARGLKEELESQFPELKSLNAQQSELMGLEPFLEKAVARLGNHNILSLGDMAAGAAGGAAGGPVGAAGAAAMRQAIGSPLFKSKLAFALSKASQQVGKVEPYAASLGRVNSYVQSLDSALSPQALPLPMAAQNDQTQMAQR
jgi:hypothetical protein